MPYTHQEPGATLLHISVVLVVAPRRCGREFATLSARPHRCGSRIYCCEALCHASMSARLPNGCKGRARTHTHTNTVPPPSPPAGTFP